MTFTVHLCTGGLAHMLRLIGTSISYCELLGRKLVVYSETHHGFQLPFYSIFHSTNNCLVPIDEYFSIVHSYEENPCSEAPGKLEEINLQFVGSVELGNRYVISHEGHSFGYNLELNEEQNNSTMFELTSGQRWPNPPIEGQLGVRKLPIAGGWPTSLRSIAINSEIVSKARERISRIEKPFVGIHFRNTDMRHEISRIISSTKEAIEGTWIKDIFLATDDSSSERIFQSEFPNIKIHSFSQIPDHKALGQSSIHYMSNVALDKAGLSKRKQIEDALCDIVGLTHSEVFIASEKSAMSQLVTFLREEGELKKNFIGY